MLTREGSTILKAICDIGVLLKVAMVTTSSKSLQSYPGTVEKLRLLEIPGSPWRSGSSPLSSRLISLRSHRWKEYRIRSGRRASEVVFHGQRSRIQLLRFFLVRVSYCFRGHHSLTCLLSGRQQQEDWVSMVNSTATTNDYFEDKRAKISNIKVPAYIGASYSSNIHTIGSLRGFEEIKHSNKWYSCLRLRNNHDHH